MITTIRELRKLIADNCDFSKPLRVFSYDVGRKAGKHTAVRVDESFPTKMSVTPGIYDERGIIEFAHNPEGEALMPEAALEALDALLEEVPRATIGLVYFFYYPMEYTGFFGKTRKIKESMLNTRDVRDVYLLDGHPNVLIVEAAYDVGSFDGEYAER